MQRALADIAQSVERILGKDEVASSNLAISSKKEDIQSDVFFFLFAVARFEIKMPQSGGLRRQPVQKLVATIICAAGANAPNLAISSKKERSSFDDLSFLM